MSRPAFLAKWMPSASPCTRPGDADLVDHLGELAGARAARSACTCAHRRRSPSRRGRNGSASPPHITVSTPFSAPAWPPDTGASTKSKPRFFALGVELARDLGRGGGVIDEHRALLHAGEGAVCAERTSRRSLSLPTHIITKSWPSAASFGVAAALPPNCLDPFLGLGGGAVVDGDLVAALVLEVPGHGVAHDAKTEKRHLRHRSPPCTWAAMCRCVYARVIAPA